MEFPLVSILVPMYNAAGCITRCVESLCAQTYKSIEILLLNDGSTDDTAAVCARLAAQDHRIAVIDKPNTGAADTRNRGIRLAHGKYIQFVDCDDWLAPDFTESWSPPPSSTRQSWWSRRSGWSTRSTLWSTPAPGKRR